METHNTYLRKVGGSVMLAVPPSFMALMELKPGAMVGLSLDGKQMTVNPKPRPKYTLAELLAASDYAEPASPEQREWVDAPAAGRELL